MHFILRSRLFAAYGWRYAAQGEFEAYAEL
jgi:hypothetical protein